MKITESAIQRSIIEWSMYQKNLFVFAVPNGGKRHISVAIKLKKEGVRAGVADLVVLQPLNQITFVEVKIEKGRQTESQKQFERQCKQLGFRYKICRSLHEFEEIVAGVI